MNVRHDDGSTEYDHIFSAANQGDRIAEQRLSELPTLPDTLRHLWEYWSELSVTRRNYGWGVTPLSYTEIYSWVKLRGICLDGWELDTLLRIDGIFLRVEAKAEAKRRASNGGS